MPDMQTSNMECLGKYYDGDVVSQYELKRMSEPAWSAEQQTLDSFLQKANLPAGSTILDIPVGTGRFLATYARQGYRVTGLDISNDMVNAARHRSADLGMEGAIFDLGNAIAIKLDDKCIDMVVSVRFLVHMELSAIRSIMTELARVSSKYIIAHIRISCPGVTGAACRPLPSSSPRIIKNLSRLLSRFKFRFTARKQKASVKSKIANKSATIHTEVSIRQIFAERNLRVIDEQVVNHTNEGYESRMFLLTFTD